MNASLLALFATLALVATSANAHMMMSQPPPRQSKGNPGPNGQIDFSYTSPLGAFPCKGFPAQASVLTVAAGSSIPVTLDGGAPHDGGHCQFALSYDGDKTFVVVDTIIRDCMRRANPFRTTVTIPPNAPSGKATFAWTWINAVGNREYYMSCADIEITGGSGPSGSLSGPELLVAHLPGFTQFSFPEFGGNAPDNRALFNQRRQITVRGGGGGSTVGPAPPRPQPPQQPTPTPAPAPPARPVPPQQPPTQPAPPQQPPAQPAPPQQPPAQPAPPQQPPTQPAPPQQPPKQPSPPQQPPRAGRGRRNNAEVCPVGAYQCINNGAAFRQCDNGRWVERPVAPGTRCVPNGDSVQLAALALP